MLRMRIETLTAYRLVGCMRRSMLGQLRPLIPVREDRTVISYYSIVSVVGQQGWDDELRHNGALIFFFRSNFTAWALHRRYFYKLQNAAHSHSSAVIHTWMLRAESEVMNGGQSSSMLCSYSAFISAMLS